MAEIKVTINAKGVITGVEDVNKKLKDTENKAKSTSDALNKAFKVDFTAAIPGLKGLQSSFGSLGSTIGGLRTVLTGGLIGGAVIKGLSVAVEKSTELENALIGVNSVARSFGQDTAAVKQAVLDFTKDGLISATDAALAFKQVLSTGTDLPNAIKLLNSLKDTAAFNRQSFYSLGEAVIATTEGIKNGNSVRADAVGVTKNLSVLEKEYAASLGKTVGQLTESEKMQARVTGFIKEGAFAAGDASKLLDTYTGAVTQLGSAYDRAMARIGNFITQSSLVKGTIQSLTGFFEGLDKAMTPQTQEDRIKSIRMQLNGLLKDVESSPYKKRLQEELVELEKTVQKNKEVAAASQAKVQAELKAKEAALEASKVQQDAAKKHSEALKKLKKEIQDAGLTELQQAQRDRDSRLKIAGDSADLRLKIEQKYAEEVKKINDKALKEQMEAAEKLNKLKKDAYDILGKQAGNPFGSVEDKPNFGGNEELSKKYDQNQMIGRGVGALNFVAGGAEGAKGLVVAGAAAGLDAFAPGLGQAAKPLLDAFAQGPEATKQMVKDFAKALPDVIEGFIAAIPVFIEELANQIPVIIERLVEKLPDIIKGLIKALPRVAIALAKMSPQIILAMVKEAPKVIGELIKGIPQFIGDFVKGAPKFIAGLIGAIPQLIGKLIGGIVEGIPRIIGGFVSGLMGAAGKFIQALVDGIKNALKGILGGLTGGGGLGGMLGKIPVVGGALQKAVGFAENVADKATGGTYSKAKSWVKKTFGFAEGGVIQSVRGGQAFTDSVPARLMNGEMVVDRLTTDKMKRFLSNPDSASSAVMAKVAKMMSEPMTVESKLEFNQREFANIILTLNRTNQRLVK